MKENNLQKKPSSTREYANLFLLDENGKKKDFSNSKNVCLITIGCAETSWILLQEFAGKNITIIDRKSEIDYIETLIKIHKRNDIRIVRKEVETDEAVLSTILDLSMNMFDLIIANPPYGKSSSLSKKIVNALLENKVAEEYVVLAPTNTYKIPELKYVQSIVRVDGHALFGDASIYDLCLTRMTKEIGPYKDYASLVLDEKELDLYRNIRVYNESHPTHFKVEKDFMSCKKDWNRMFAFSFAINNGGSTDVKPWSEIVDLTPYTEKHQGPTADIKFNFGNDFEAYYNNLRGNVSYPRLIDMGSTQEKNNFKNWYYKAGRLVNRIRSIISQCENITPRPQCYIDYFPHVDWSHPWTDQEILKELGLPEDFLGEEPLL